MTMRVLPGAVTDALTKCYIKEYLAPTLAELKKESELTRKPFSILIIDVDHFKSFNDKYGHMQGDEVLKYFSSTLHLSLVDEDNIPFRFGGDEFIVVFPAHSAARVHRLAVNLQNNIKSRMFLLKGKQYLMTFSGGVATYPDNAKSAEDLLQKADQALYCSKENGRARSTRYDHILMERMRHYVTLLLIVAAAGAAIFFYREELTEIVKYVRSPKAAVKTVDVDPKVHGVATVFEEAKETFDEVVLKSGDILIGKILVETAEEIRINLKLGQGEATIVVKKADILKTRKISAVKA